MSMSSSARQAKLRALQAVVCDKRDACDELEAQLPLCNFVYTPPRPNFDSRRVMGTICNLIDVCDPRYCTALEVTAEEQLFAVVVDTEETAKLLMEPQNLPRPTTFIILDRANSTVIDRNTVKLAQQIGGGPEYVQLALDLVSFDSKYQPAMDMVFGSTLVVRDWDMAERLAFHPDVECRAVTMDGEVIDSCGTRTYGPLKDLVLARQQVHKKMVRDLKKAEAELSLYTGELEEADKKSLMED